MIYIILKTKRHCSYIPTRDRFTYFEGIVRKHRGGSDDNKSRIAKWKNHLEETREYIARALNLNYTIIVHYHQSCSALQSAERRRPWKTTNFGYKVFKASCTYLLHWKVKRCPNLRIYPVISYIHACWMFLWFSPV